MRLAESITTKNITSVDEVQSVDNTDKVFVNDNGSFKQISVSNLMKQAPSGVTEETDPTVSEWAKQPTKPSYTADEVGALPVDTKIPTKTSDLTNDSGYLTQIPEEYVTETELGQKGYVIEDDIPEKLPSPGILTFTGAVNDTYDGSVNKTINIPTGGGTGGTTDYNDLSNKPQLNGVTLEGNKTLDQVGVLAKNQGSSNSGKYLSVGSDGNVTLSDAPSGGTVDPEQIKQAVNGYLEENPVSGMTAEQEQQLNQNTSDVSDLKSVFNGMISSPYCLNRALIASDNKIYYKAKSEENYTSYNLFLFDVSDAKNISMRIESSNNIIRVGLSSKPMNELISDITGLFPTGSLDAGVIYNGTIERYDLETLDVSTAKTMMVYVGADVTELDYMPKNVTLNGVTVYPENTTFIHAVGGTAFESYEYTENNPDDILAYDNAKQKLYAYKNTSANPTFAISFPVDTDHTYKITASGITRCRIGLFDTNNLIYGTLSTNGTNAYATIAYDDTKTDIDVEFVPEINGLVVAYLSNTSSDVDVTVQSAVHDSYVLESMVKIGNDNIPDNSIKKEKLGFNILSNLKLSDILVSSTEDISPIFEFDSAPDDWVTDSTGKVLDVSTDDFYDLFYNTWVGNHADGFTVTKTQLGMDQSGQYPIYEYDFCPQNYTYTVLLSSGMHTYELSAHFGLAWFMKTYMRQVDGESLSDGFEYLRKHVRIKVVPISNPWGWNQSPKKYGNVNGVNINRNFDYETDDGGSAWEQFPVQTDEWNQKGSAPFSEAEARILRDWALANPGAYFWIDCHTGLGLGPWDNFIYYSSDDKYADKIVEGLSALEERIKTKYSKQNPTKEVRIDHSGSIRLRWGEKVAGIPGMTIEQTPNNTLWGTILNNESGDITEYAVTVYCYLLSVLPNIDAETWIQSIIQPITSAQKNALNHLIQKDTLNQRHKGASGFPDREHPQSIRRL